MNMALMMLHRLLMWMTFCPGLIEGRERVITQWVPIRISNSRPDQLDQRDSQARRVLAPRPNEFVRARHLLPRYAACTRALPRSRYAGGAGRFSAQAHKSARCRYGRPWRLTKYQLEAEFQHTFMRHGSRSPAYSSSLRRPQWLAILHYTENTSQIT